MNIQTLGLLINNAGLLLAVSILNQVGHLVFKKRGKYSDFVDGLILGVITITVMVNPVTIAEGLVFDTRSIILSVSALYMGPVPSLIAATMAALYRFSQGGIGNFVGIAVIYSVTAFGLLWRQNFKITSIRRKAWNLYWFGLSTHVIMLLCMFILPIDIALATLTKITLPVLFLYPLASMLLSVLIQTQEENQDLFMRLAESESTYRSFFDENKAVVLIIDPSTGGIKDANKAAAAFYGYDRDQLINMNVNQINTLPPDEVKSRLNMIAHKEINHFEFKHRLANGEIKDVEVYTGLINFHGKKMLYSIIHDITQRVKALSDLEESEIRFKFLVENAPYAIFIQLDYKFYFLNKMACKLFGVESPEVLIGQPVMDRFHPEYHKLAQERIKNLNVNKLVQAPLETVFLRIDNTMVDVSTMGVPFKIDDKNGALVFAIDITAQKALERKKLEFEMKTRQQQKLEAIGQLAGGVAHEINNPINGIMNYAQLILDSLDDKAETQSYAKAIINETDRVSEIVRNLLQFARMEKQSHSYASIYDIIERTVSLTKVIFRKDNIELDIRLDDALPDMKCRSQQIQQVLMNLLTNAKDALNDRYPTMDPNKKIEIRAHLLEKEKRKWIELSVKDYGTGIDPTVIDKIYEPFFSTKMKDKGTGLGLAISYGIVNDHHGEILVESVVGDHTEFKVILPVDNGWDNTGGNHE